MTAIGLSLGSNAFGRGEELRKVLPGGFVFPAFTDAIKVNPAYLLHEKRRNLSLFYEAPDNESAPNQYNGKIGFASSNGKFGYGALYEGSLDENNRMSHDASLGFGMGTKDFSLAVAVNLQSLEAVINHYVNLAFRYGKSGMYYQLVMHEVNADTIFEGGIGFNRGPATLEASLRAPHFSRLGADPFTGSVAVSVDAERFGAAARARVTGLSLVVDYQISVYFRPKEHIYLILQYQDPRRVGFGLTLSF